MGSWEGNEGFTCSLAVVAGSNSTLHVKKDAPTVLASFG